MSYYTKITKAGLAAITAAMNNNSKVPITYMAFGDGNGYIPEPDENATSLVNEVYRVGVNKVEVHNKNPNWLVCEAIIPSAVGGFNIREVALYDSTGNTMLAIASYPPTYKPTVEEGAAKIQTIRIVIQVDNSGNFELLIDPDVVLATAEMVKKSKVPSLKGYDAKYQIGVDDQPSLERALANNDYIFIENGETEIGTFRNTGKHIVGLGRPSVYVNPEITPVAVQLRENSITENIDFYSMSENKEWQRVEMSKNSKIKNCGIYGFRHNSSLPNSWGIFLNNTENVSIDYCRFADNTQSDIALVDDVKDVIIIQPSNTVNGGVHLNVEPNNSSGTKGLNIFGGKFRKISLLENSLISYASENLNFYSCNIDEIQYDGSGASFYSCKINRIINVPDNIGRIFAGELKIDNASLSENLISDPYLVDVALNDSSFYWKYYNESNVVGSMKKVIGDKVDGNYIRINESLNFNGNINSRNKIIINPTKTYVICARLRSINSHGDGLNHTMLRVSWYNSDGASIKVNPISTNRGPVKVDKGWRSDVAILTPPVGAVSLSISILNSNSVNYITDISYIGLYQLELNTGCGNFNSVIAEISKPIFNRRYKRSTLPISNVNWDKNVNYLEGDIIYKDITGNDTGAYEWLCTESGVWDVKNPRFKVLKTLEQTLNIAHNFGSIPASGNSSTLSLNFPGINFSSLIAVSFSKNLMGCEIKYSIPAENKVDIFIINPTASAVELGSGNILVKLL